MKDQLQVAARVYENALPTSELLESQLRFYGDVLPAVVQGMCLCFAFVYLWHAHVLLWCGCLCMYACECACALARLMCC